MTRLKERLNPGLTTGATAPVAVGYETIWQENNSARRKSVKTSDRALQRFLVGWACGLVPATFYTCFYLVQNWIINRDQWMETVRWLQQSTTFCFHQFCAMPVAVGIFAATFKLDFMMAVKPKAPRFRCVAIGLLVVMLALTAWIAWDDYWNTENVPPFQLASAERQNAALDIENDLRTPKSTGITVSSSTVDATAQKLAVQGAAIGPVSVSEIELQNVRFAGLPIPKLASLASSLFGTATSTKTAAEKYDSATHPKGWLEYGLPGLIVNVLFSWFAIIYFWYLIVLVAAWHWLLPTKRPKLDSLMLIMAIFILWLPARVYASWYSDRIFRPDWLSSYGAFWLLAMLALGGIFLLGALSTPNRLILLFSGVVSVITGALAIIGHLQPRVLESLAITIERMPTINFFSLLVAATASLFALAMNVLTAPKITAVRQPERLSMHVKGKRNFRLL